MLIEDPKFPVLIDKTKFPAVVNNDICNKVAIDIENNRLVVSVNDSGYDGQQIDLIMLLRFVKKNMPILWDAINTKMDKSE